MLVDTLGLVWGRVVHEASVQDRDGAKLLLLGGMPDRLRKIWADGAYAGKLVDWVADRFGKVLEIVGKPPGQVGFSPLPKRWVGERTFAWLNPYRLLAKEYELSAASAETDLDLAMIHLMIRRLRH